MTIEGARCKIKGRSGKTGNVLVDYIVRCRCVRVYFVTSNATNAKTE